jgi:hypothetical protein
MYSTLREHYLIKNNNLILSPIIHRESNDIRFYLRIHLTGPQIINLQRREHTYEIDRYFKSKLIMWKENNTYLLASHDLCIISEQFQVIYVAIEF